MGGAKVSLLFFPVLIWKDIKEMLCSPSAEWGFMWDRHSCLCLASLICLESQQGVTVLSQGPLSGSFHTWDLAFGCSVPTNQPLVSECYIPQFIPGVICLNSLTIWGAGVWHVFSLTRWLGWRVVPKPAFFFVFLGQRDNFGSSLRQGINWNDSSVIIRFSLSVIA